MEDKENDSVLNAIIIASVIGILIVAGLILFYPRPSEDFTAMYFGNYTKYPVNGAVRFNVTFENHENRDMNYSVIYKIDNETLSQETVFIPDKGNITLTKSFGVDSSRANKIRVLLNDSDEIHFWTKI